MRAKIVKKINKFLNGLQHTAGITDQQFKNVRKHYKRHVSRNKGRPIDEVLAEVRVNDLLSRL